MPTCTWALNAAEPGLSLYINSNSRFVNFMQNLVNPAGASAMITVNYGSDKYGTNGVATNDINEAAAWVAYANITNNWGVKYWEICNEQQGNGFYGSQWEEDLHVSKSPITYGTNAVLFINAMKAVDPTIKVGVGMVQPGTWPDANESPPLPFDKCVLTNCASAIDFVILHWYPDGSGGQSAATLLSQPSTIPAYVRSVRSALTADLGATRAAQVGIAITETDANTNTGAIEALFCADEDRPGLRAAFSTWNGRRCTFGTRQTVTRCFWMPTRRGQATPTRSPARRFTGR